MTLLAISAAVSGILLVIFLGYVLPLERAVRSELVNLWTDLAAFQNQGGTESRFGSLTLGALDTYERIYTLARLVGPVDIYDVPSEIAWLHEMTGGGLANDPNVLVIRPADPSPKPSDLPAAVWWEAIRAFAPPTPED